MGDIGSKFGYNISYPQVEENSSTFRRLSYTASSIVILLGVMTEEYSFTPVKPAQRSLADDEGFWVSPGAQQLEQKERNAVLATAAIKEDLQEDKLKQLVEAAREVVIKVEEGKEDAVPQGLEFMLQQPGSAQGAYSQVVQLMEAAKVGSKEGLGWRGSL